MSALSFARSRPVCTPFFSSSRACLAINVWSNICISFLFLKLLISWSNPLSRINASDKLSALSVLSRAALISSWSALLVILSSIGANLSTNLSRISALKSRQRSLKVGCSPLWANSCCLVISLAYSDGSMSAASILSISRLSGASLVWGDSILAPSGSNDSCVWSSPSSALGAASSTS